MTARYGYRRWDGSQDLPDLDTDDLLAELTDDLLAGGDLGDSLRRILRAGIDRPGAERVMGLRDLIERLRARRRELEERGDPGGRLGEIAEELKSILDDERAGIDALEAGAEASGDERRREVTATTVAEHRIALDLLPDEPAQKLGELRNYEWVSPDAAKRFEELLEQLRQEVADTFMKGATEALSSMDDAQRARLTDAFDALNRMIEQRSAGEDLDPSFEEFKDKYGDLFPDADTLDELLERLAERMAAAAAMMRSLSPEQRRQLQDLSNAVLDDMNLRWQVERLSANLQQALPEMGWDGPGGRPMFSGQNPLGMSEATDLTEQLADLERMEDVLGSASSPAALSEIDLADVQRYLGDDAARSLDQLSRLTNRLVEEGLIANHGGRLELTPRGVRRLGQRALSDLFATMRLDRLGDHRATTIGSGHDREETSKPYEHGDPFNLDLIKTVHNAVRRGGSGVPVRLDASDFEVVETEALARSATVLAVDLSMSMPMRDNFVPAKKMAMALHTLITTRFPRDFLGIVGFSEVAREIRPEDLPTAMWDYVYGTNLQHALLLSRRMLAHEHGTKQIIVVTDGEPTAHIDPSGEPLFSYPPIPETLRRTMAEVVRCTRAGITINTFALDLERTQYPFVEQIGAVNGGRTFYTSKEALGGYVLVDFLRHRRFLRPAG